MSDVVGYRDQLMDYVYEQAGGSATEGVPVLEFAESVGLDLDGAFTLLWYCRDEGLVSDKASGMGHPCATLTSYGIADALARRQRRADPALRARACRAGLLRWLYAQHAAQVHMPPVEGFGVNDAALWEGVRFSPVEIEDASVYLSDKGLIEGTTVAERRGPTHARITNAGIDCVTDWEGDVTEYLRDQRGYGPTYNGPYIQGHAPQANMAWQNSGTVTMNQNNQQVAPGFEELAMAVVEILKQLPTYGLTAEDQQDAKEAANDVLAEVTQPQPEPRRVRKAVAALRGFLAPIVVTSSRAEVQLLAQHGIDKLNHAIGM